MPSTNRSSSRNTRTDRTEQFERMPYNDPNDDDSIVNDEWHPTDAAFSSFLSRDFVQAISNIGTLLKEATRPITVREIKDSCLHSIDVIDRVLASGIATGIVTEDKGRYAYVQA